MYEVKPTSVKFDIQIPDCMYKVKVGNDFQQFESIHTTASTNGPNNLFHKVAGGCPTKSFDLLDGKIKTLINDNEMADLEARQVILLEQLHKFKARLLEIRKKLKLNETSVNGAGQKKAAQDNSFKQKGFTLESEFRKKSLDLFEDSGATKFDIVINAHPKFVPYGLLAIKNAWKNDVNFCIKVFSHSTLPEISPEAKHFQKQLTAENDKNVNGPTIDINLIWKNCEHTEMISAPTMYKPIYGEINILRFLCRIGPLNFRYDFAPNANEIDIILDMCYQLLRRSGGAQLELIKELSDRLAKQKYFGGKNLSVADIAVSSSLKRIPQAALKNLPENMKKWYNDIKTSLYL